MINRIKPLFYTLYLGVILINCTNVFGQSPWLRSNDEGYFQLGYTHYRYDKLFNGQLDSITDLKRLVTDQTAQLYFEYGILDRLTLVGNFPFKLMETGSELLEAPNDLFPSDTIKAGTLNKFGNIFLSLKYGILKESFPLTLQIGFYSPGSYNDATGLKTGYDCWMFEPRLSLGKGFKKHYFQASGGYQYKSGGYNDYALVNIEGGRKFPIKKTFLWLMVGFDVRVAITEEGFDDRNSVHTGTYQNNDGHVGPALKLGYEVGPFFMSTSLGFTFWENHGGSGALFNFSLAYKGFKKKED